MKKDIAGSSIEDLIISTNKSVIKSNANQNYSVPRGTKLKKLSHINQNSISRKNDDEVSSVLDS